MAREIVNILLVEDDEAHAEAVRRAFRKNCAIVKLEWAPSIQAALASLEKSIPHLVIADWLLPDGKGIDLLPSDRELFPVILMTSHGNEKIAVDAMKAGVLDYVVKSPSAFTAMPRIAERALREWDLSLKHKRAQEALRQSERRFRTIFEKAEDYIFLKDWSLRYIDVNPAYERLVGRPASKIIGLRYDNLFGHDGSDHIGEIETRVLTGETIEEENTRQINGVSMTFLDTRVPVKDESGEIVGILGISRDITDRKRREPSPEIAGNYPSKAMKSTLSKAAMVAKRASIILLAGESGSGKDYLAQYIHNRSDRSNGPYLSVNCAAIAPQLAESELFGHEKGAFTGAHGRKRGLLELAEGGTLLLNEIGELSLALQAKLLTFLDTRKFTRVGGEKEITVNARLIAATNRDLEKEVLEGRFRKDLYYRLNVMTIRVPPLRDRQEDIPVLVQEILSQLRNELHLQKTPAISPAAMNALKKYNWPGNVRELRNVLERDLILSQGKDLDVADIGLRSREDAYNSNNKTSFTVCFPCDDSLNEITQEVKRFLVNQALHKSGGSRTGAARLLGISRYSLKHYMKSLGFSEE
ncbi:MAG: sigma 54-interacting transcriptional regulator [Desulfomonilaceae bacterium]